MIPTTMRAAVQAGADGVRVQEVPVPAPGPDDVRIRVHAAALNRADLGMAAGHKHGSLGGPGTLIGMECAGEVVDVGAAVRNVKPGDRVMASGKGAFAEYMVADHGRVSPLPRHDMPYADAATLPVALQTMHDAVVTNGRLQRGDAVLIQGASSGVGLMGLQIAKLMGAGLVIGSSTNAARRAQLASYGAELAIDSADPRWPEQVLDATGGRGVDLIVDQLAGAQMNANLKASALRARIVNVGRLAGTRGEFDFDLHALKRIDYVGVTFRTRTPAEVREINVRMRADLGLALRRGDIALPIATTFPFEQVREALAHMAANAHFGKIVLAMPA